MRLQEFMERYGVDGFFQGRNGARLYIYGLRFRLSLTDGRKTQERAFINLDDYSLTVRVDAPHQTEQWRRDRIEEIRSRLAPAARLARIRKVKPEPFKR